MRRFARAVVLGLIALVPVAASADTISKDFTITISGPDHNTFLSSPFDKFNPSLGTLTSISETLSGSATWTAPSPSLLILELGITGATQLFNILGTINIGLSGVATQVSELTDLTGTGQFKETLVGVDIAGPGGSFSTATLAGTITYGYTVAAPIPEPPALAIFGLGLAALVAVRRSTRPAT